MPGFVVLQSGGASIPHGAWDCSATAICRRKTRAPLSLGIARRRCAISVPVGEAVAACPARFRQGTGPKIYPNIGGNNNVEAAVRNYETAFRMQSAVPSQAALRARLPQKNVRHGFSDRQVAGYGLQCLLARRLVERGVRFIELSCLNEGIGAGNGPNPWDQHGDLERGHRRWRIRWINRSPGSSRISRHGLLDETLIIWAGEFGRTPACRVAMAVTITLTATVSGWQAAEPRAAPPRGNRRVRLPCHRGQVRHYDLATVLT